MSGIPISSNALVLCGDNPIQAWEESDGGRAAKQLYYNTARFMLMRHPWTFCTKTISLNMLTSVPPVVTGYTHYFQIPSDNIRIWKVFEIKDYDIEENLLLTNTTFCSIKYTRWIDEAYWPPAFVKSVEYQMASELALSVREDVKTAELRLAQAVGALAIARNCDSTQKPQVPIQDAPLNEVRF